MPEISASTFAQLMTQWKWKPIRNCRGRFLLSGAPRDLSIETLAGFGTRVFRFHPEGTPDTVAIVPLVDGGLIAYEREDGTVLHTLNDPDGFERKMRQLGISFP
jgi:hypothetical protein